MKVLLVEPWMSGSHAQWAVGFASSSSHDVSVIGLPAGPWRWRLRTGSGPLATRIADHVRQAGVPDILLVSGLVDVAQLLGISRRSLPPEIPVVVYQHESQLVYPTASGRVDDEAVLRNWSSWLAADHILFNSKFHRDAVAEALPTFFGRQPAHDQNSLLDAVLRKFDVVPVGVDLTGLDGAAAGNPPSTRGNSPLILWPHRWEPDKDPEAFARALEKLDGEGLEFRLALAGDEPLVPSLTRQKIIARFADRIDVLGPLSRDDYVRTLVSADIVVSCAKHEFFGVAVVEALAAGCVPVLPRALSYPELVAAQWQDRALYTPGRFGSSLAEAVRSFGSTGTRPGGFEGLAESMTRFSWSAVGPTLDAALDAVLGETLG